MFNDTMQGKAHYLGIILSGTPQCMEDPRRGVYSYEALRSRLAAGHFSGDYKDLLAPVIYLQPLTPEELLILTEKLTEIHGLLYEYDNKVTQEDRISFIRQEFARVRTDSHITPRDKTIGDFLQSGEFVYAKSEETPDGKFAEFTL